MELMILSHLCRGSFRSSPISSHSLSFRKPSCYILSGETGGGPMSHRDDLLSRCEIHTWPNPFVQNLNIGFLTSWEMDVYVSIYDVTGRLVKNLHKGVIGNGSVLRWQGKDEMARTCPQGIYFLRISNPTTDRSICRKIIKID